MNRQPDSAGTAHPPVLTRLCQRVQGLYTGRDADDHYVSTPLPWLSFIRFTQPTELNKGMLEPSMCMVLQGLKKILIGRDVTEYGAGSYVLSAIDMPISGQVTQASPEVPYLGIRIDLNIQEMADLIIDMKLAQPAACGSGAAAYVTQSDADLQDAFLRLITMLDKPQELQALGALVKKEIFYRLITDPKGDVFYHHLLSYYQGKGVRKNVTFRVCDQPVKDLLFDQRTQRLQLLRLVEHGDKTQKSILQIRVRLRDVSRRAGSASGGLCQFHVDDQIRHFLNIQIDADPQVRHFRRSLRDLPGDRHIDR